MAAPENINSEWDIVVKPKAPLFALNISELWRYRDLISILIRRDITTAYKQTVLGPIWMVIQPIFTTLIYTFTFSMTAKISTDNIPPLLFYFIGQVFWLYFADCLNKTSSTFYTNASIFGKVYFPRLVMPIATVFSTLIKFLIQFSLVVIAAGCYLYKGEIAPRYELLILIPFIVLYLGIFGMSIGIVLSSITTKYRDFIFLIGFGVQLLMFASCVTFPLALYGPKVQMILQLNPLVPVMELTKSILTGHGVFSTSFFLIDTVVVMVFMLFALIVFNRTEKNFMDTV